MKGKRHNLDRVIRSLGKKSDCLITVNDLTIQLMKGPNQKHDLGNKSWSKIDYLRSQGFTTMNVRKFQKSFYTL